MTLVKICGITNLEDALVAVEAGADALGFNFYRPSPRYISPAAAREIINSVPPGVMNVGVFVNEENPAALLDIARTAGVNALQLHGDESPSFCAALDGWYIIKVFSQKKLSGGSANDYNVSAVMVDAGDNSMRGGTGRIVDWSVAAEFRKLVPKLFLAGGLSPTNIGEAITSVRPYAVDACSGLEATPGKKNHRLVRAFLENVRAVQT
ncbi:MAG TPA: phosphoribosylanthranilate isomerase [Pyrinomonadaceae bacterium]|nr:phosphoribosylanthranilate isomerase [Pyrinomonadaceae bacterium]